MLYGSEVDKPTGVFRERKRAYRPQTSRPAPRREHVMRRLREGWTIKAIAAELGVGPAAVHNHVKVLRGQEGARGREELMRRIGVGFSMSDVRSSFLSDEDERRTSNIERRTSK